MRLVTLFYCCIALQTHSQTNSVYLLLLHGGTDACHKAHKSTSATSQIAGVSICTLLDEPFSPNNGNGALPHNNFCKLNQNTPPGTTRDLRPSDCSAFSCQRFAPKTQVHATATRSHQISTPSPECLICRQPNVNPVDVKRGVRRCPPHIEDTQRVKRSTGRYAVHGYDHRWGIRVATLIVFWKS